MSIWNIPLGWFVIVALAALFLSLIGMELACWKQKRDMYISKEYTCADCGEIFESARTEEEAVAEKDRLWGKISLDKCAIVCDDYFNNVMKHFN